MKISLLLVILCAGALCVEATPLGGDNLWDTAKIALNIIHKHALATLNTAEELVNEHGTATVEKVKTTFESHRNGNSTVLQAIAGTSKDLVQKYTKPFVQELVQTYRKYTRRHDASRGRDE